MSKEQINYILALATLFIVWLYFNTFYVNARRNPVGNMFGGMPVASGMRSPGMPPGFPQFPRMQEPPKAPELKDMTMQKSPQSAGGASSQELPKLFDKAGQSSNQQGQ